MLIENIAIKLLQANLLAVTQTGSTGIAYMYSSFKALETWLTYFAMVALVISLLLMFWLSANHKCCINNYNRLICSSSDDIDMLRKEVARLSQKISDRMSGKIYSNECEKPFVVSES